MHREIDTIRAAGAALYVIGNGTPSFIVGFREQTGYAGSIYTDPSLAVYKAAELKRGVLNTFDPRALGKTISALSRGRRQGRTQGDPWQQGGVLVIAPTGEIRWHHVSDRPGDNATADDIVAALPDARPISA
ncbi:MAG: AhpC/TSA family protein [Deltaproteobacteria bacterium]|nr:AhpC/TSA family protein [Deltaproteobacteria bacterium]MDQ3296270.1 AhpC/TSA family protein [Myxococcota bacterium]